MEDLVTKLGLDWKLLLAQMINFLILVWVLRRFAYRPIVKLLDERRRKIERGLEDAKQSAIERTVLAQDRERTLHEAQVAAAEVGQQAQRDAEAFRTRARDEAKAEAQAIVAAAEREAKRMQARVVEEAQAELGELVALGVEKVVRAKVDAAADRQLIAAALRDVGGQRG